MNVEVASTIEVDNNHQPAAERVSFTENFEVTPEKEKDWVEILHEFTKAKLDVAPVVKRGSASSAERVAAYLDQLDGIISRVIRADVDCEIGDDAIDQIDSMRAEITSRKNDALTMLAGIHNCQHTYEGRTDQINQSLGKEPESNVEHEVCTKCGKINTITRGGGGDHHSGSGKTYRPEQQTACVDCDDILYKNASGDDECLTCNKVMSKTASPRSNSRFVTDPFLHALASDIINAKVSSGYSLEDCIKKAEGDFKLTDREQFLLRKTIKDMGLEIGQMIWLAPAQTTYASVNDAMTKTATENDFVNDNLELDTDRAQNLLGEVERALSDSGFDLDDIVNSGVTSREDLMEEITRRLDSRMEGDAFDIHPKDDYLDETGFDTNPNVPPYDKGAQPTDIAGEIASMLMDEVANRTPDEPLNKKSVWKNEIRSLINEKLQGMGQMIIESIEDVDKFYERRLHPQDAAAEMISEYMELQGGSQGVMNEDMDSWFD